MDINTIAWISFTSGIICRRAILMDIIRLSQRMWIMNSVWPITALYSGPVELLAYSKTGRTSVIKPMNHL